MSSKAEAAVKLLVTKFPAVFDPLKPHPLKIGISHDLVKAGLTARLVNLALSQYVSSLSYQIALARGDEQRIGLDGQPTGEVTLYHRTAASAAVRRLNGQRQTNHKAAKPAAAKPAPQPAAPSTPTQPAAPPPRRPVEVVHVAAKRPMAVKPSAATTAAPTRRSGGRLSLADLRRAAQERRRRVENGAPTP